MQFQPEAALRNQDTGVYLIARVMASDEPLLSAESTKEMRCAQCNESLDVLAPGVRCRSKMKDNLPVGNAHLSIRVSADC